MVALEEAVIARLRLAGKKFEVLVDPEKAFAFRRGVDVPISDVLVAPDVYREVRTAERVSEQDLMEAFGTTETLRVAERILKEGELQLTTEQRHKMLESKMLQIADLISKRAINPQTDTPHPAERILKAMRESGVRIDPFTSAEQQVESVVKAISSLLPIKLQRRTLRLCIPPQYAGRVYAIFRKYGEVVNERWLRDGSLEADVKLLAGLQDEFFKQVSALTAGNFTAQTIEEEEL